MQLNSLARNHSCHAVGRRSMRLLLLAITVAAMSAGVACNFIIPPPDGSGSGDADGDVGGPIYNNTTDATNKSATYIGGDACRACHPGIGAQHTVHGHAHKLTRVQGEPPQFPAEGTRAGVPNPPEGFEWTDITYIIGGYTRKGRFIDNDGYILTTGVNAVNTQWNLSFPANGTTPGFVPYEPDAETPKPYDYSCFVCHTTGAKAQNEDFPEFQENRPGFIGTWEEAGVQCEACHGPGSNHIPNPAARDIFVDSAAAACGKCHTRGDDPTVILAKGGYIQHHEQWPELLASGGHAEFNCTICHDPHVSANYDLDNAIRNQCTDCHTDQSMALHEGKVYTRSDYTEQLSCVSCHMPYATKSAASAGSAVVGDSGRMGDTKTHIFRIDTQATNYSQMFTEDGSAIVKDSSGLAGVSLDFVCLRCHNGIGSAPIIGTMDIVSDIATGMHGTQLSEIAAIRILRTRGWDVSQDGDSAIRLRGW
ncbi:MAG: cytochrome c3 family protein [Phycisphaerales bacterium]|nr:cytochrome c3 family protein [Phycisphaerales bacterium]